MLTLTLSKKYKKNLSVEFEPLNATVHFQHVRHCATATLASSTIHMTYINVYSYITPYE